MDSTRDQSKVSYRLLLATVAFGGVLAPINSTMLAVALPELRHDFDVGHAEIAWLVSAYLIAMAVAQPLGGRLGDQLGRGPVFRTGLALFLAFSLAIALSPTFEVLILLRTCQALIGAAVIPNGMAMLRETQPVTRLGRSGGFIGSAISISAAVGPLLGAGLLELGSWRYIFIMNVPLVVAGLVCFALLRYPERGDRKPFAVDWAGAVMFAALLVTVTLLLNSLKGSHSDLFLIGVIIALPVVAFVFIQRQLSTETPIAEWQLFRNRSYSAATAYVLLSNLVMYTVILAIPFFVEEVQGKGHAVTGSLLGAVSVLAAVLAPIAGRVSDSMGRRQPAFAGSLCMLAGVAALLVGIQEDSPYWFLATTLALLGLGLGLSIGPSNAAAIESSPRELAGAAAGTNSMMRYLGSIIGVGMLGAVLNTESGGAPEIGVFRLILAVLVVMAALASVSTLFIHKFTRELGHLDIAKPAVTAAAATEAPSA